MTRIYKALLAAAASAAIAAIGVTAASAAASASPAASGTEHFSLMTTLPSSSKYTIIASGVFTAGGVDHQGNSTDTAKFANGSFKIHHGGGVKVVKEQINSKTCLGVAIIKVKFTLGGGTGAYKGLSGSGTATINDLAIFQRSKGRCNPNANAVSNEQTITATAHVKL
jgi:hypothetical protein